MAARVETLSLKQAARVLGLPEREARRLAQAGLLRWRHGKAGGLRPEAAHVAELAPVIRLVMGKDGEK